MPENPEYLSVAEAAKRLNVSQSFLNKRRVYGGGPPYLKFQSTIRYEASSLVKWADPAAGTRLRRTSTAAAGRGADRAKTRARPRRCGLAGPGRQLLPGHHWMPHERRQRPEH